MQKKRLVSIVRDFVIVVGFWLLPNLILAQSIKKIDYSLVNQADRYKTSQVFGFTNIDFPSSYTLENYALVSNQAGLGGVSFSVVDALNIMHNKTNEITDNDSKYVHRFDPYYIFCSIKDISDSSCVAKDCSCESNLFDALEVVKKYGAKKSSIDPFLNCYMELSIPNLRTMENITSNYRIDDYYSMFSYEKKNKSWRINYDIDDFKHAIASNFPIVTSIYIDGNFEKLNMLDSKYSPIIKGGKEHAVTIVGYDDSKYGGAFKLLNNYGDQWGESGFFWMTYNDYFDNSSRAFVLVNESNESWDLQTDITHNTYYRSYNSECDLFWEGFVNEKKLFDGKGIEETKNHVAIGTYINGLRESWWLVLEKSHVSNPRRGLVYFSNDEILQVEPFGFANQVSNKTEFYQTLQTEFYNILSDTND